jgi:hypothetical protein
MCRLFFVHPLFVFLMNASSRFGDGEGINFLDNNRESIDPFVMSSHRLRLTFLTSVGVKTDTARKKQEQREQRQREQKREHLHALLSEDCIDLNAVRAAVIDGALLASPGRDSGKDVGDGEIGDGEIGVGEVADGAKEREIEAGKERAAIQMLRSLIWKLLLAVLPMHSKSWAFYARQQQEWYSDLQKAAVILCKGSPMLTWSTSSLRFTFNEAALDERTKSALFKTAERLMLTLDLKELVSSAPAHACSSEFDSSYSNFSFADKPPSASSEKLSILPLLILACKCAASLT